MFARFTGVFEFECPDCAAVTRARLVGMHQRVICGNGACRHRFILGAVLYRPQSSVGFRVHKDLLLPIGRETFPPYPQVAEPERAGAGELRYVPARLGGRLKSRRDPINSVEELPADLR